MRYALPSALALLLLVVSFPSSALAQSGPDDVIVSTSQGLAVQAHLGGHSISTADNSFSGAGISLAAFYGLTDLLGARASFAVSNVESEQDLSHLDLSAQFSFRSGEDRFLPYARGGVSRVALSQPFGDGITEIGFTTGLGLNYFLSPQLALDASLDFSLITIDDRFAGTQGAGTGRLAVGVSWFPTR